MKDLADPFVLFLTTACESKIVSVNFKFKKQWNYLPPPPQNPGLTSVCVRWATVIMSLAAQDRVMKKKPVVF